MSRVVRVPSVGLREARDRQREAREGARKSVPDTLSIRELLVHLATRVDELGIRVDELYSLERATRRAGVSLAVRLAPYLLSLVTLAAGALGRSIVDPAPAVPTVLVPR